MKIKDLKSVLYSTRGGVQFAVVYDQKTNTDLESGCSIEYAVNKYGEEELQRIEAFEDQLILSI